MLMYKERRIIGFGRWGVIESRRTAHINILTTKLILITKMLSIKITKIHSSCSYTTGKHTTMMIKKRLYDIFDAVN
jgi:hypothetical protein